MFLGVPISIVKRLGWTTAGYAVIQVLRFANNVVLARLLAPPIFGLMAVVNAIRTGVELLSDVGITQNIVSNPAGDSPNFYDTAWTLQVLRGLSLGLVCILCAAPAADFFHYPQLKQILPIASLFFIFTGLDSTTRGLVQKQLLIKRSATIQVISTTFAVAAQVALAFVTRTVWALVVGGVIAGATTLILSFLFIPGTRHRFMIDRDVAKQLMTFGKWVFFSSIIYFFAMNFDRLYFAKQISLSQLGVYGIARSLADMVTLFVQNCTNSVLYPSVAAAGLAPADLRQRMLKGRRTLLLAAAIVVGLFLALAGPIVRLLYDVRYREAATIVPILCVGVWFNILAATNDAILLGLRRPAYPAVSNAAKLATYIIGVPLAFYFRGFTAAIFVISAGEVVKYGVLWICSHKQKLHFGRDDLVLTLAFAATAVFASEIMRLLGAGELLSSIHNRSILGSIHL